VRTLSLVIWCCRNKSTRYYLFPLNLQWDVSLKIKAKRLKLKSNIIFFNWLFLLKKYTKFFLSWMNFSMLKKLILPIFIVSIATLLLLSPLLYYSFNIQFYTTHSIQSPHMSQEESLVYVQNVYSFLQGKEQLSPVFTLDEKSHMQDVQSLFFIVFIWEIIAFFLFFIFLVSFILQRNTKMIVSWFLWGTCIALVLFLLLLFTMLLDFDAIFLVFHRIFFPQGNWSFNPLSLLIQLFPLTFFNAIAMRIFLMSAGMSLLIFLVALYERKKK